MVRKCAVLAVCLCLCLTACGKKENTARPAKEILTEMISDYGKRQDSRTTENYLSELEKADKPMAEKWRRIMAYWEYANREMPVITAGVPHGLPEDGSLCITVLGYRLCDDGTPAPELIARLDKALTAAEQYPNACILCTGGGTAKDAPDRTEAEEMRKYLTEKGIPSDRILVENRSLTTGQNAEYSYELLRQYRPEVTGLLLVSTDYHIPWASALWQAKCILSGEAITVAGNAACLFPDHLNYPFSIQATGLLELAELSGDIS